MVDKHKVREIWKHCQNALWIRPCSLPTGFENWLLTPDMKKQTV